MNKNNKKIIYQFLFSCEYGLLSDVKRMYKLYNTMLHYEFGDGGTLFQHVCGGCASLDVIEYLIDCRFDIKPSVDTCLYKACQNPNKNSLDLIKWLVEDHAANVNKFVNNYYPLTYAVLNGDLEVVKYLVEHGANVMFDENDNGWALRYAIIKNDKDILYYLLENGTIVFGGHCPTEMFVEDIIGILIHEAYRVHHTSLAEDLIATHKSIIENDLD